VARALRHLCASGAADAGREESLHHKESGLFRLLRRRLGLAQSRTPPPRAPLFKFRLRMKNGDPFPLAHAGEAPRHDPSPPPDVVRSVYGCSARVADASAHGSGAGVPCKLRRRASDTRHLLQDRKDVEARELNILVLDPARMAWVDTIDDRIPLECTPVAAMHDGRGALLLHVDART
jgi:hypothetical protein